MITFLSLIAGIAIIPIVVVLMYIMRLIKLIDECNIHQNDSLKSQMNIIRSLMIRVDRLEDKRK